MIIMMILYDYDESLIVIMRLVDVVMSQEQGAFAEVMYDYNDNIV